MKEPDLKDLVKELAATLKRAATDLEAVPYQTRASLTSMVHEARERADKLKAEYFRRVRSNTLGMFLFGAPARVDKFMEIAAEEAGVLVIQGDALYQALADKIESSFGPAREFGPTQLEGVIKELRDQTRTMGIRDMNMPKLNTIEIVPDRVALVAYLRKLVQTAVGDELLRMYLDRKINDRALEQAFAGKVLPVAVVGLATDEVVAMAPLFTNSVTVEVGTSDDGEVTKDYVLNQLAAFRKKVKGNNKPETA